MPNVINAVSMNDAGGMSGYRTTPSVDAWVKRDGVWTNLGILSGYLQSVNFGINGVGDVVGFSFKTSPSNTWATNRTNDADSSVSEVATVPHDCFGYGINDAGDAVGVRNRDDDTFPDPQRAWYLKADLTLLNVHNAIFGGSPTDEMNSYFNVGRPVNNNGKAVGVRYSDSLQQRGFVYDRDSNTATVLEVDGSNYFNDPRAINDQDQIVGEGVMTGFLGIYATQWEAGAMTDLGIHTPDWVPNVSTPDISSSRANSINEAGDTCGTYTGTLGIRAWVKHAGTAYDLTDFVGDASLTMAEAYAINASRQILCRGYQNATPGTDRYYLINTQGS